MNNKKLFIRFINVSIFLLIDINMVFQKKVLRSLLNYFY
jgi:hypothetical protein